ncbi:MAG: hypothetical protein LBS52_01650 [Dysgonamonadaceae bacterium]|jgi:hypothetical protein|nr:hypothetical protein [Dysgonamonadaceae bacterium]
MKIYNLFSICLWMMTFTATATTGMCGQVSYVDTLNDDPGTLRFYGSETADLFTKEVESSFRGVLKHNYIAEPTGMYEPGFVRASPEHQGCWDDTFWTRDGGTFLRELVQWGYLQHACLTAQYLMSHVTQNEDGFYTFPEYFRAGERKSGNELDGTSSIVIALSSLWIALDAAHPLKEEIYEFLHNETSPLRYLHFLLKKQPLIAGEGEFGGGYSITGKYYNVVQNYLCVLALFAGSHMAVCSGDIDLAANYRQDAKRLQNNMLKWLQNKNNRTWYWCVNPQTLQPDADILNHPINIGFSGILGINCMYSDVLGLEPLASTWKGITINENTFEDLYRRPLRREQFTKYGIWPQFDVFREGLSSGASYGDGYALQTMLLYDKMDMVELSLKWLSHSTYSPVPGYQLRRESPYYFYERSYSPDAVGKLSLEEGCGALNLVNVSEPLKAARLIMGVNSTVTGKVELVPRLPASINEAVAENWPLVTPAGIVRADISCKKENNTYRMTFRTCSGEKIPEVVIRLPSKKKYKRITLKNVSEFSL